MDADQIWWKHIIKPNYFLNEICETMSDSKSIMLIIPKMIPWYNTMLELIKDELREKISYKSFDVITCPSEVEVGEFILEKYCKKEKRGNYRTGISYAKFLGESDDIVLHDRFIWVENVPPEKCREWIDFISEYNQAVGKRRDPAVFVLETSCKEAQRWVKKGIKPIIYEDMIAQYDRYTFCTFLAAETNYKSKTKQYLADLAASICGNDAELCALCVQEGENFLKSPCDVLDKILKENVRSDGSEFNLDVEKDNIDRIIWECQLRNIFPLIENFRSSFIKKHEREIQKSLPITNSVGDIINTPEDVEVGSLCHLAENGDIPLSSQEYKELNQYRTARNHLAHLTPLTYEEVTEIL